eukprot:3575369-Amphidinium_carterae.1
MHNPPRSTTKALGLEGSALLGLLSLPPSGCTSAIFTIQERCEYQKVRCLAGRLGQPVSVITKHARFSTERP